MKSNFHGLWFFLTFLLVGGCSPKIDDQNDPFRPQGKSLNLTKDIQLMWDTSWREAHDWKVASQKSIPAAERVFKTVNLTNLSRTEVSNVLRLDLKSTNYAYNAPFYKVDKDTQVI